MDLPLIVCWQEEAVEVCLEGWVAVWIFLTGFLVWWMVKVEALKVVEQAGLSSVQWAEEKKLNPEKSGVTVETIQAGSGPAMLALSAVQHMLVWEEASLLDGLLHFWFELDKMDLAGEMIYPGEKYKVTQI